MAKKSDKDTEEYGWLGRLIYGQVISLDFFKRHWLVVFTTVIVIMLYITQKYNCQTKMEEIRRLNTELEIVKTEHLRVRSMYMSNTRESSMQHLIDSLGLSLRVQEQPPFKLDAK
ncbi:MAG: hypothetical protein K2I18_07610 [Paramuribaculum sp.]|nr:hypothetical protein [Paramuribaculum sp.]